jgi:hypothetical protein
MEAVGVRSVVTDRMTPGLATLEKSLVITQRITAPLSASLVVSRVYVEAVAPGIGAPSRRHWTLLFSLWEGVGSRGRTLRTAPTG